MDKRVRVSRVENIEGKDQVAASRPRAPESHSLDQRPPRPTTSTVAIRGLLANDDGVFSTIGLSLNFTFVPYGLAMSRTTNG